MTSRFETQCSADWRATGIWIVSEHAPLGDQAVLGNCFDVFRAEDSWIGDTRFLGTTLKYQFVGGMVHDAKRFD